MLRPSPGRDRGERRGVTFVEVLVALVVILVVASLIAMALPAWRENARLVQCQRHLAEIGVALLAYDNATGHLPTVPEPDRDGAGPLAAMLGQLGLTSFAGLAEAADPPRSGGSGPAAGPSRIAGLVCPTDPYAADTAFPAPVSYRATTGPGPDGLGGPFAIGRRVGLEDVRRADGAEYTAGFAERLVGTATPEAGPRNYATVAGPIGDEGCGEPPPGSWRGDAGSDWSRPDWASSLYNHALRPDASPSCLADDGRSARMGASSEHAGRVHVLMLDGRVRPATPRIDPAVWGVMASVDDANRAGEAAP